MGDTLIYDSLKDHGARTRAGGRMSHRLRELAEAGASGAALTSLQVKEICEALRSQNRSIRNQFHSGN